MLRAQGWIKMKQSSFRESFITAEEVRSDEKSFGVIFSVFFFLISIYLWMRDSAYINISAGLTIFFLLSAFTVPKILRPLNIGWFYFGKFLHLVISPIIMSIIFFLHYFRHGIP